MSPKRVAAQPQVRRLADQVKLQNNLLDMKIFILLKNTKLIIKSKTPDPFNLN